MSATINAGDILHNPAATISNAKHRILLQRRHRAITADAARDAWTDIECCDEDLESQIATLLDYPAIFGREPWHVIRGWVRSGDALWRDVLQAFVRQQRELNGALFGEIRRA